MEKDREMYEMVALSFLIMKFDVLTRSLRRHFSVVSPRIRVATFPHANKRAIIIKIITGGDC